jgi:hypothetical protein
MTRGDGPSWGTALAVFLALFVLRSLAVFSSYFFQVDEVSMATGAIALVHGTGAGIYHYTPHVGYYRLVEAIDLLLGGRATLVPAIIKGLSAAAGAAIPTCALFAFASELTVRQRWLAAFVLALNPLIWIISQYGNAALVATAFATGGLVVLSNRPSLAGRLFACALLGAAALVRADTVFIAPVIAWLFYRIDGSMGRTARWCAGFGIVMAAIFGAILAFDPMADNAMRAIGIHMASTNDRHFWGFVLWSVSPIPLLFALWGLGSMAGANPRLLFALALWAVPTLVFYAPAATIPRYFVNVMVPVAIACAVGLDDAIERASTWIDGRVARAAVPALAAVHLFVGFAYLPWDRGITAPLRGSNAPTQGGEELPTGALLYRTFSNRGVLAWSLPNPQFGTTDRYWEAAAFARAIEVLADPQAPKRTVIVLLSGGWAQALHYHAEAAGARYLSRRPLDSSGTLFVHTWLEIGNARVDTIPWRPVVYDLVPRFDVTAGDEIWVLGRKPFPDEESLQKLPPGLSLVAADGFDPNIRVFRVTAAS